MPTIGKFVIGNVATLQSASNIYFNPTDFTYVNASSSNMQNAFKNLDDALEDLSDGSVSLSANNTFSGKLTASNGLVVSNHLTADDGTTTISSQLTASNGLVVRGLTDTDGHDNTLITADGEVVTISGDFTASQGMLLPDDTKLFFGTGGDASIEYDEDGTDELRFAGAAAKFEQKVTFEGDLTASQGFSLSGGSLVINKGRLGVDSNAGNVADSIMLFDNSDSDLAKTITITQLNSLIGGGGGEAGDFYLALTGSNTVTGDNTFSGKMTASNGLVVSDHFTAEDGTTTISSKLTASNGLVVSDHFTADDGTTTISSNLTASNGLVVSNHLTADNGTTTISSKLTASNGINISGGELIMHKSRLTADSNAGQGADSLMIFDSSDSDLAKTITIAQLSSLVGADGAAGDFYAALTSSNSFTGANTFSHLTASKGIQVTSGEAIKADANGAGNLFFEAAMASFNGMLVSNGAIQGSTIVSAGAITASNGLTVMSNDDGVQAVAFVADSGSFTVDIEGAINIATSNEEGAAFPIGLNNSTSITGELTVSSAITASNGLTVTSGETSKGATTALEISHDGNISVGVEGLAVNVAGEANFYGDVTASNGIKVITDNTSTTPTLEVYNQGTGDAALMWSISGDSFAMGIDNGSSDRLKISYANSAQGATLGTNDILAINSLGYVGIGDNTPDTFLDVEGDPGGGNWIAAFKHTGGGASDMGVKIQAGGSGSTGGTLITFADGQGTTVGAVTFASDTVSYGTFTGAHYVSVPSASNDSGYDYGTLLSIQSVSSTEGSMAILYSCSPATSANDASVLGIYGNKLLNSEWGDGENVHQVFALGDGHILVCNEGGDIARGDYIASSNTAGHGMKQSDDLLHNYTVAKATEAVVWADEAGTTKLIACTYHCG